MVKFSSKTNTTTESSNQSAGVDNTSSVPKASNEDWKVWNEYLWNAAKATAVKVGNKETKTCTAIGYLNYIQQIGCQPQNPVQLDSNLPHPAEGEANSPEELARMLTHPTNSFHWVDEWKDGVKSIKRKVQWPSEAEEEIILAIDIPSIKVNYSLHPSFTGEKTEDTLPLRLDYNGKWNKAFNKKISNEPHWKTKKLHDKAIQYKIAAAIGVLEAYQNDEHDLAYLAQACCNWDIVMTKNIKGDAVFYKTEIKDPSILQDIAGRTPYTVAEQLEDNPNTQEFCGILFNGGEYSKEQLEQVRFFWWQQCSKAIKFDKNLGTPREGNGTWFKDGSCDWVDSDLYKAAVEFGIDLPNKGVTEAQKPLTGAVQKPESVSEIKESVEAVGIPAIDDFSDDIPFAPIGLQYPSILLSM